MAGASDSGEGIPAEGTAVRRTAVALLAMVGVVSSLHVGLGRLRIASGARESAVEMALATFDASAIAPLRAALDDAEEIHPRRAWQMRAEIRRYETAVRDAQKRVRVRLAELDVRAADLAAHGEFRRAAAAYATDDPALRRVVREWRADRLAELERLASGAIATPP